MDLRVVCRHQGAPDVCLPAREVPELRAHVVALFGVAAGLGLLVRGNRNLKRELLGLLNLDCVPEVGEWISEVDKWIRPVVVLRLAGLQAVLVAVVRGGNVLAALVAEEV